MTATLSQELLEIADANDMRGHTREVMDRAAEVLGQIERADEVPVVAYRHSHTHSLHDTEAEVELADGDSWAEPLVLQSDHIAALTAQSGDGVALLDELRNIANAKPEQWDPEMRGQFREWAQNRARAAIAAYEAKRGGVPADTAIGGKGA